ncbi:hypothetical protein SAMN05421813_102191 [Daejeonella rubra]|uniref:Uncharacterized protein n=1 Tax=Daejeonella rubra TaxID=990371 RepID=A0A1G9N0V2_9SPHI|nr:hypothetical protein [Daejeonella rubra]SDL80128.1 hypothetical protein SAMN05421813_102191 [Daejeonella rubra]
MKATVLTLMCLVLGLVVNAQDFNSSIQAARQSYSSGNLEDSRFAMQQMLQEIDILTGKEVLKILPNTLGTLEAKIAEDQVSAGVGFAGAVIHRLYQTDDKSAVMEIISNSPLIGSINAILSIPFIGTGANGERRVVKIDGYKALIQKSSDSAKIAYDIQVPLGSTLITVRTENYSDDILKLANSIPVALIAQKLN